MGNRTKLSQIITLSLALIGITGCINEDIKECPPVENNIELSIKDKNYINVDNIPQLNRIDENLPFNNFVQTLNYSLQNKATGEIIESTFTPTTDTQSTIQKLTFTNLPEGEYELAVFGNTSENTPSNNLHPDNKPYTDIYVADTTFSIKSNQPNLTRLPMERAKGMLLIICENFPSTVTQIEKRINFIYRYVDTKKNYSDTITVTENTPLKNLNQTYIAPTKAGMVSSLNLSFLDDSGKSILNVPPMNIQMKRNEATVVSVVYKSDSNLFEIWSNIDGKWMKFHQLTFEK